MAITVPTGGTATGSANSASPTVTFTGYTPATNDVVVFFIALATNLAGTVMAGPPSGWVNADPAGGTTRVESDTCSMMAVYHAVTSGEASGGTTAYTATALIATAQNHEVSAVVLRGVDPTTRLDSSASGFSTANAATPHIFPALVGANLSTNSMVVGGVINDGTASYTTPGGWTLRATSATIIRSWCGTRDTLTTAGVAVAATNITPSVGDEYCAYTLAFTELAVAAATSLLPARRPHYGSLLQL